MNQGSDILNDVILMDISPFSLGVQTKNFNENKEIRNKLMSVIITKGSKIPIVKKKSYTTTYYSQTWVKIEVYEGEKKYVKDNHLLGKFKLVNLPPKKVREVTFDETFSIDSDGILTVSAIENSEGIKNSLKIINDRGYNKDEIAENIKNVNSNLISIDNHEFKNYKKDMNFYYNEYNNSNNTEEKYTYIYNFGKTLIEFLNKFDKKGNDTLGNKYFLYIKTLFESFKKLIQLKSLIDENHKNEIINTSKHFLKILSFF